MPMIVHSEESQATVAANRTRFAFILVTSLFFLWGFAYGLLDSLNKHFQDVFQITKLRSAWLQAAYFGGYFLMALPAGIIMKNFGYKRGILIGLGLYAAGAFFFYPSAQWHSFNAFLLALFVLACGLCCLETAANPYVTVLGPRQSAAFRINLAQSFNGVGSFLGPFLASQLFFKESVQNSSLQSVQYTYLGIAILVVLIAGLFYFTPLPEINEEAQLQQEAHIHSRPLFQNRHFVLGVAAQFFYVAAQVGVAAFFINYVIENWEQASSSLAAVLLGVSLILFTAGRFIGTLLMKWIEASRLLALYAVINILLCVMVIFLHGQISVIALMIIFFFESIMFPTIFALGVRNLGQHTRQGGSFIIMSIVGGALSPLLMGWIADHQHSTAQAFVVPLICFAVVAHYGFWGHRIRS
ncbi:FHS family L-fucose permease-like MFS transporter [Thermoflavifilum aggregans]|uniref:FHS family L-fucose permease-like MFS transporter n=1 Tax=Thermoflavifilum aggregans TaxID=454188 RepID=A0A2M9CVG5_9BACT|nr:sugar MFS transporter [Thermoflavifilum aggregans]MBX6379628.1 sugar MFS transporter [Thermoflavifilum aggregans]PJJ75901.1 FHS family L-fucose permease-like MFS transporter [Thermoflavifilum aggregans]